MTPAASGEEIVFGACRPGYESGDTLPAAVETWIQEMQSHDIKGVCCLLADKREYYEDLLGRYKTAFRSEQVCHAPIIDRRTVSEDTLTDVILPFLRGADDASERVVVHCSAGMGRTGHVLALWLACERGYSVEEAIEAVEEMGRRPLEAATLGELEALASVLG